MSAITGIFYRDGRKVDPELIKKMNDRLSHRGPDGSATWCEGSVALGHQMLWTTPESLHEKLPFHDEKAGLVITADARIDNRKELSEELGVEDKEDVSDSYFILKAYEKWGEKCPEYLLGDFAFAIWDENEEKLFCARDHMGVKPFYYYLDEEKFVFGTEIKALFCVHGVPKEINELQIVYHLSLMYYEKEITSYENILRLPAAHILLISFKENKSNLYWKLDPNYEIQFDTDEEYEKVFLEIFTEAVRCRLRSAFPVGSMLSGGVDSSSVASIAQKILKIKGVSLKTFSAIFDSVPESNERYYIEKVLSSNEFDPYFIKADEISPLNEINDYLWYGDQLLVFPNTFMSWNIYRKANSKGVRVLLDGLEGDIVVSHGKGYLNELARRKMWKKLFIEVKCFSKRRGLILFTILIGIVRDIIFKRQQFLWIQNKKDYNIRTSIIEKRFAKRIFLMNKIAELNKKYIKIDNAHKQHYYSLSSGINQYGLEVSDWMAVPFSIEPRHPFYDKRLVEFCLAIPTEQKFSNGWDRFIMRQAMENILPIEVQWRKTKGNLGYNHNQSMIKYEKKIMDDIILKNNYLINKYIDVKKLQKIYNQFKSGNTKDIMYIWQAIILSLWIQKLIKRIPT